MINCIDMYVITTRVRHHWLVYTIYRNTWLYIRYIVIHGQLLNCVAQHCYQPGMYVRLITTGPGNTQAWDSWDVGKGKVCSAPLRVRQGLKKQVGDPTRDPAQGRACPVRTQ